MDMRPRLGWLRFVMVLVLGAGLAAAPGRRMAQPPQPRESRAQLANRPLRPLVCAPPTSQRIYAPLPPAGWGDAELLVQNRRAGETTVSARFFRKGAAHEGKSVTLGASQVRWLRLDQLAGTRRDRGYDGIELSYDGILLEVGAQLTLLRERGGNVDIPFSMAGEYASLEQQAVWPVPSGARAKVLVGNASEQAVSIRVESSAHRREMTLEPYETAVLQDDPGSRSRTPGLGVGWMRLMVDGPLGSVRATGYVEANGRPVAGIRFYDPAAAKQANLYASNVALIDAQPMLVLKNTGETVVTATARFLPRNR